MTKKRTVHTLVLGIGVALAAVLCVSDASAQDTGKGKDKSIAAKKGVSESLATKKFDQKQLPGKMQYALALGSIGAAVAAIKWL